MGLVKLAGFDPPAAVQYLEKTVAADPRFVDAYVYLARIWLGSEYLARAQKTIDKAMRLAPHDGSVLSLAGFVRLAYRDYEDARKLWDRAIKANPRLGEPHLGLAIYHFRCRQPDQGLTEMLSATLLEPRVSLYQSYLGKALYQTRAFDKALEVFDYAKSLDPQDPTPHFYKGIALTDLNRPGEAIQEINQSIALNDNTAIFRSRLGLDQDRALRNYNLARAYDQLRLREWAYSKAVTAVKSDPYNSSAHLFLEKSYTLTPQGQQAAITEDLFFRLLAPANENTFFSFKNDNYTPMFEMPYLRLLAQGGIGAWKEKYTIQEHNLTAYGGWPGAGFYFEGNYVDDRGFRPRNNDFKGYSPLIGVKWEPTVNNSFTGAYQYADFETGDVSNSNDYAYPVLPLQRTAARYRFYEFGFVHRFNPRASLLLYFNYQRWDQHFNNFQADTSMAPFTFTMDEAARQDTEFGNFQLQQHLVLGKHNLMAGFDYFSGNLNFRYRGVQSLLFGRMPLFTDGFRLYQEPPERTYSFYLFDYWRISPKLLIELGVIKDFVKNTRAGFGQPLSNSLWSPIVGINFYLTPKHTLRAAVQRHLITHSAWAAASLIPTETAGFPWLIWLQNGTELRDAGVSWEAEWDAKTFSVLRLTALRSATPNWVAPPGQIGVGSRESVGWKKYQASFIVNRILATYLGLGAGVQWARVVPDYNPLLPPDFTEFRSFLELSFLHRTGLQAGIRGTLLNQNLKNRENNLFGLMDLRVGYEFPHKRGLATLEINNVFNRGFFQALDPATSVEFYPSRRILFKFALYF